MTATATGSTRTTPDRLAAGERAAAPAGDGARRARRSAAPPEHPRAISRVGALAWALGTLAYAAALLNRSTLGVVSLQAGARFGVGPALLSTLAVVQLATYAGMQIPVGTVLDRLGSRRLIATGALLMAAGETVFALAPSFGLAVTGRVLIGLGDAMTFLSVARVTAQWFPRRRIALFVQITAVAGGLGSVTATLPLVRLLGRIGWEPTFLAIALLDGLVAVAVVCLLPEQRMPPVPLRAVRPAMAVSSMSGRVREAWAHPATRLGLWLHFSTALTPMMFTLLWGFPYLVQAQGMSPTRAASLLLALNVTSMVGAPVVGQLSGILPRRRVTICVAAVLLTVGCWTLMIAWPGRAPLPVVCLTLLVLAIDGPVSMAGLDVARTHNPVSRIGTVTGIANIGGYSAALGTMLGIGATLEIAEASHLVPDAAAGYRLAFCLPYVAWAVGLVMIRHHRRRLAAR